MSVTPPNRLREHRTTAGFSQEELAMKAGLSVFTISRLERGRVPKLGTAQDVAEALGIGVVDIWPELAREAV